MKREREKVSKEAKVIPYLERTETKGEEEKSGRAILITRKGKRKEEGEGRRRRVR